jgi:hypothetical protein
MKYGILKAAFAAAVVFSAAPTSAQRFDFAAFGEMPDSVPADYARIDRLVDYSIGDNEWTD